MNDKNVLGFIGTGVMGSGMAGHLMATGNEVHVYNRTRSKAEKLIQKGAVWEASPADLASKCSIIFTIVGYPKDVEEIYLGKNGLIESAKKRLSAGRYDHIKSQTGRHDMGGGKISRDLCP